MRVAARAYLTAAASLLSLVACTREVPNSFQGYAEGEYVHVAAPYAGLLTALKVRRGDRVQAGAALYVLEQGSEAAARREAAAELETAEAHLADLQKGRRAPELDAVRAQLVQAEAALRLSQLEFKRQQQLVAERFVAEQRLDEARTAVARDRARVAELRAQLQTAQLAARSDQIRAAQNQVAAARAALEQAQWRLEQKSVTAPVAGQVTDTLYVDGEWVGAGAPVIVLLPRENIKVRFFLPEPLLSRIRIGQELRLSCDGCETPLQGKVSFVSPQAEYTPPVIYSRDSRSKLVFMVEASLEADAAARLHPGQPVDVSL